MIYDKVGLYFGPVDSFKMPLDSSIQTSKYIVKSIDGLDPPAVNVAIGNKIYEGGVYQGRRAVNREIVMMVGFRPDYDAGEDIGTLRTALYSLLTPKLDSLIGFYMMSSDESKWVRTTCMVKNMAANPFSKDPEVQITFSCFDAYLEHGQYHVPNLASLQGTLQFNVTNEGNAPSGFYLGSTLTAARSSWSITNADGSQKILLTYGFLANDKVNISTIAGERFIHLVRGSTTYNLLAYRSADSEWIQLHGGTNTFKFPATTYTLQSIYFTPRRWGV